MADIKNEGSELAAFINGRSKDGVDKMSDGYGETAMGDLSDAKQGCYMEKNVDDTIQDGRLQEPHNTPPDVRLHDVYCTTDDDTPTQADGVEEGWYSWIVLLASLLCMTLSMTGYFTAPVLLVEWKEAFQVPTASIALSGSIQGTLYHSFCEYDLSMQ